MLWRKKLDKLSNFWSWIEVIVGFVLLCLLVYELYAYGLWPIGVALLLWRILSISNTAYQAARP